MLQPHLGMGMNVGLTELPLQQLLALAEMNTGKKDADAGRAVWNKMVEAINK